MQQAVVDDYDNFTIHIYDSGDDDCYGDGGAYLIFVTGATGGARVNLFCVIFFRFNAKNWQFTV